jgi:hypothetical protein
MRRERTDLSLTPLLNCFNDYCVQIRYGRDCCLLKIAGLGESRVLCGRKRVRLLIMDIDMEMHSACVWLNSSASAQLERLRYM